MQAEILFSEPSSHHYFEALPSILSQIDKLFWENELEVPLEKLLIECQQPNFVLQWLYKQTEFQVKALFFIFFKECTGSVASQKEALCKILSQLIPYYLVSFFEHYKVELAILEVAKEVLNKAQLEISQIAPVYYDKKALLFFLFYQNPEFLKKVYYLNKMHRKGFVRMRLYKHPRLPQSTLFEFLSKPVLESLLVQFDIDLDDRQESQLKELFTYQGQLCLFIRRAERERVMLKDNTIVHGYRPAWIILLFEEKGRKVQIAGKTLRYPMEIANRIATAYFNDSCTFEEEIKTTQPTQIKNWLNILQQDQDEYLKLVEIAVGPLEDDSHLILAIENIEKSLKLAFERQNKLSGDILSNLRNIAYLKVLYKGKKITIYWEYMSSSYVMRYSDYRLDTLQKSQFEQFMDMRYGLTLLSAETSLL